jgi:hypothetical protein
MNSAGFTTADCAIHSRNDDIASTIYVLAQTLKSHICSKKVFTKESFSIRFITHGSREPRISHCWPRNTMFRVIAILVTQLDTI